MFKRPRIIPVLSIINEGLVKTVKYNNPRYLGDPINAVKILNTKGVDELCIIDIRATINGDSPNFDYLENITNEAFMPLGYGGGITKIEEIEKLFYIGFEKIIINSSIIENSELIKSAVKLAGSQSIVISIDVKKDIFGGWSCYTKSGTKKSNFTPVELALEAEKLGVGEILLTSITKDGCQNGYDLELINLVASSVNIPVIAYGGAGNLSDLKNAFESGAHAVAASSMFMFYGKQNAVLITFPSENELVNEGIYSNN